jgi:hypothetical protein
LTYAIPRITFFKKKMQRDTMPRLYAAKINMLKAALIFFSKIQPANVTWGLASK